MFANKRIRFFSEREGLTFNTGKILEQKLQKAQYLPEEMGEQFAPFFWLSARRRATGSSLSRGQCGCGLTTGLLPRAQLGARRLAGL